MISSIQACSAGGGRESISAARDTDRVPGKPNLAREQDKDKGARRNMLSGTVTSAESQPRCRADLLRLCPIPPLDHGPLRLTSLSDTGLFQYTRSLGSELEPSRMPWTWAKLNDGRHLPGIGFGSSGHPNERTADDIELAIGSGFEHIDTAQSEPPSHAFFIRNRASSETGLNLSLRKRKGSGGRAETVTPPPRRDLGDDQVVRA